MHGVRTAANAGCRAIVLTNGCGGLKETWTPGTPVLISDHINLTGRSPIEGANFVDLTDLYSSLLRPDGGHGHGRPAVPAAPQRRSAPQPELLGGAGGGTRR